MTLRRRARTVDARWPSAATSVGAARRQLRGSFASTASTRPSSTPASWSATRSVSTTRRSRRRPTACSTAAEARRRSPRSRRAGSRASRSRASSGAKEFWGLPLALNAETLVPRPETETVVEAALAALDRTSRAVARVAHRRSRHRLGRAAAGAALASCRPRSASAPTSASRALACARDNAGARASPIAQRSSPATTARRSRAPFDLVVSNPPYVAGGDIATLAARGARLRSPPRARWRPRRPRCLSGDRRRRAAAACPGRYPRGGAGAGQLGAVAALFAAAGLAPAARAARSRRHCAGPGFAPAPAAAMSPPHSRCAKKHLDCGPRPTRFRPRNRPETVESTDSEPRSRTAESRRCGRSEPRAPDDPAGGSPTRDEMLHRFGADPRVIVDVRMRKRWATRGRPRSCLAEAGGCCFATRNLTSAADGAAFFGLLLERARMRRRRVGAPKEHKAFGEATRRRTTATRKGLATGKS